MSASHLPGGFVHAVVRVGDTVRRPASARTKFVGELLRLLEAAGWNGAPRYLGTDDQGREVLSHLDGHVAWEPRQPAAVSSDESLVAVARLVREFHDLTAGTALAGDQEVVCHNDLSPRNTVYRPAGGELRPVAFIDWDLAAPGKRIHDVAHVCWQYLGLGPAVTDIGNTARRMRLIADGYGLEDRSRLVPTILWWQDRCVGGASTPGRTRATPRWSGSARPAWSATCGGRTRGCPDNGSLWKAR
ncbi:aminoglycoside phosphotransferase family protein [Streptomyces sp. DH24]|uniref:aminoglycoside phosphotransferase family protein n=1 Tax=Streptomyces sp. DH24 TaxID=3040123 RepID=UPI002441ECDC|nr:aminoglycoside phosphotransferase family protein [Streptomyces sp. DH24]MDG9715442.1 aminoglycoside phosphotransferase family protein [Streptomyces sp. DH24]